MNEFNINPDPIENPLTPPKKNPDVPKWPLPSVDLVRKIKFKWQGSGFHGGPRRKTTREIVLWSWFAATIDSLIIFAISVASILIFLKVQSVVTFQKADQLNVLLFIFVMNVFVYFLSLRIWMGCTVGEWACEIRLGLLQGVKNLNYVAKVFLRISFVLATGLVLFPILSMIYNNYLLGLLLGLPLTQTQVVNLNTKKE